MRGYTFKVETKRFPGTHKTRNKWRYLIYASDGREVMAGRWGSDRQTIVARAMKAVAILEMPAA